MTIRRVGDVEVRNCIVVDEFSWIRRDRDRLDDWGGDLSKNPGSGAEAETRTTLPRMKMDGP